MCKKTKAAISSVINFLSSQLRLQIPWQTFLPKSRIRADKITPQSSLIAVMFPKERRGRLTKHVSSNQRETNADKEIER